RCIERAAQCLLNRSKTRNECFRHRLQRIQAGTCFLNVSHRLKGVESVLGIDQRFESAESLDKLAVLGVEHRDLKTRQAGEFIRMISKPRDLIETDLEHRLHVVFPQDLSAQLSAPPGEMLEADREKVPHF